jgi:outer membrane lipoprotein-sorting protein
MRSPISCSPTKVAPLKRRTEGSRRRLLLSLSIVLVARGTAHAGCTSTDSCLHAIETAQRDTRTLAADFVQVKHVSLLNEPLESTGHLVFKRPDRILLRIDTPQAATIVVSGHEVRIPNLPERERQALALAPMVDMFTQLGAIFTGATDTLRQGFVATAREEGDAIRVELVPRQAAWKQRFRSIELRFAGAERVAQVIRLEDGLGDNLEITLHNVQRNGDVPDSTFDLAPQ